jgi:hypothetical protein
VSTLKTNAELLVELRELLVELNERMRNYETLSKEPDCPVDVLDEGLVLAAKANTLLRDEAATVSRVGFALERII